MKIQHRYIAFILSKPCCCCSRRSPCCRPVDRRADHSPPYPHCLWSHTGSSNPPTNWSRRTTRSTASPSRWCHDTPPHSHTTIRGVKGALEVKDANIENHQSHLTGQRSASVKRTTEVSKVPEKCPSVPACLRAALSSASTSSMSAR